MIPLIVLPNFRIIVFQKELVEVIRHFADSEAYNSQSETFIITASSYWKGLNKLNTEQDFIEMIKNLAEKIPQNVLKELENWKNKFGEVSLEKENCLKIVSASLVQEILNHSVLKNFIYDQKENLIFFKDISLKDLSKIFESEFNCPIRMRVSKKVVVYKSRTETFLEEKEIFYEELLNLCSQIHPHL